MSQPILTGPCLSDFEMTQVVCYSLVFREFCEISFLDLEPVLGSALRCMAVLLLRGHVWPTDPVFILSLALQVFQHVAFHLPCDLSWTSVLPDPLLSRDAFPQQSKGEEHGAKLSPTIRVGKFGSLLKSKIKT